MLKPLIPAASHPNLPVWITWFEAAGWSPQEVAHLFNLDDDDGGSDPAGDVDELEL